MWPAWGRDFVLEVHMLVHVINLLIRDYQKCQQRIPSPLNKTVKGVPYFPLLVHTTVHCHCPFQNSEREEEKRRKPFTLGMSAVWMGLPERCFNTCLIGALLRVLLFVRTMSPSALLARTRSGALMGTEAKRNKAVETMGTHHRHGF